LENSIFDKVQKQFKGVFLLYWRPEKDSFAYPNGSVADPDLDIDPKRPTRPQFKE
jgi:hypothetical protein